MPRHLRIWIALAMTALLSGCGSKKLVVNPAFTTPEGIPSSSMELITFYDMPNFKIRMIDRGALGQVNIGADTVNNDQIARDAFTRSPVIIPIQAYLPGTVRGLVLNRTPAEGLEVFRTESNGAVRRIFEFAVPVTRRWIDGLSESYEFTDSDPKRVANATYYTRGLLGGSAGASSPLSNGSRLTTTSFTNIQYLANRDGTLPVAGGGVPAPAESTFLMRWSPVTGTARYLIHVFQYQSRALSLRERVLTGAPAPILPGVASDIFIASVPGSVTEYKMGAPGATIYTFRTPRLRAEYFVRISAIDANGQMIGMTTGPTITQTSDLGQINDVRDYFSDFADPEVAGASPPAYLLYSRGAARVSPGAPLNP
ncbi:MAG: hypothetical protein ABIS67_07755 [Candidatus Eisenbacteria bacterium]